MEKVDTAIIGAGVIGLAIGAEIAGENSNVVILEKNPKFGQETSSRNSEVIHSGIHYLPGSLKAELCVEGNGRLYEICERNSIGFKKLQKLTVANNKKETEYLYELKKQGEANGVNGIRMLGKKEIAEIEPEVTAEAALLTPSTGIIDSHRLMEWFSFKFKEAKGIISYNSEVVGIEKLREGYKIRIKGNDFSFIARNVINCAGLYADRVAGMAGIDIEKAGYKQKLCKGEYFALNGKIQVSRLIYGVPSDTLGLGIHIVINMAGNLRLGPNAFFVDSINYDVDINHRKEFFDQAIIYFKDLKEADLSPDTSGIRPKLSTYKGAPDFIISEETKKGYPGFVNLIGIESPGLTSSPAIAKYVKKLLKN